MIRLLGAGAVRQKILGVRTICHMEGAASFQNSLKINHITRTNLAEPLLLYLATEDSLEGVLGIRLPAVNRRLLMR